RWSKPHGGEDRERDRYECAGAGPDARRAWSAAEERHGRGGRREEHVGDEQAAEAVAMGGGECEDDRQRDAEADRDRPEQPFFEGERTAALGLRHRQPEYRRSEQPCDGREGEQRLHGLTAIIRAAIAAAARPARRSARRRVRRSRSDRAPPCGGR